MFDAAVVGLGVVGSAVCYELARRGMRVLGLERDGADHGSGASRDGGRMCRRRLVIDEPPDAERLGPGLDAWLAVAAASPRPIFSRCGALLVGQPGSALWAAAAARSPGAERLRGGALRSRLGGLALDPSEEALWDPEAGVLHADAAVDALRRRALQDGTELRFGVHAKLVRRSGGDLQLVVEGEALATGVVVVCAGAWLHALGLPGPRGAAPPVTVERVPQAWYARRAGAPELPVVLWDHPLGLHALVPDPDPTVVRVVPRSGRLVRAPGTETAAEAPSGCTPDELAPLDRWVRIIAGAALGDRVRAKPCFYVHTTSGRPLIERVPGSNVLCVSACNGGGFKHALLTAAEVADAAIH